MKLLEISKIHTVLVGIMMIAILLCCSNQVQAAQDGDYVYNVTDGKAIIIKYSKYGTRIITIPSTLGEPL